MALKKIYSPISVEKQMAVLTVMDVRTNDASVNEYAMINIKLIHDKDAHSKCLTRTAGTRQKEEGSKVKREEGP